MAQCKMCKREIEDGLDICDECLYEEINKEPEDDLDTCDEFINEGKNMEHMNVSSKKQNVVARENNEIEYSEDNEDYEEGYWWVC